MATLEASSSTDASPGQSAAAPLGPRRRQISLRGLFLCTAYFAVSSALATKFGLGIFVLMNGIFLTWLSFRGYLWWMQSKRARPKTYGVAWLLFAVSFGLPTLTVKGCGSTPPEARYGWEAALMTVETIPFSETERLISDPTQRTPKQSWDLLLGYLLFVLWNMPNLLMLASPYVLYRQQIEKGDVLSALFGCAAVSSWTWGITGGEDLRVGYYVWSTGITAIALAKPPGWRSLLAMGGLLMLWLTLGQLV